MAAPGDPVELLGAGICYPIHDNAQARRGRVNRNLHGLLKVVHGKSICAHSWYGSNNSVRAFNAICCEWPRVSNPNRSGCAGVYRDGVRAIGESAAWPSGGCRKSNRYTIRKGWVDIHDIEHDMIWKYCVHCCTLRTAQEI